MKTVKLALLGFGNAAQAFIELLLAKQNEIMETRDTKIIVTAVSTRSRGSLKNADGVDIRKHMIYLQEHGKFDAADCDYCEDSSMEIAQNADYDILVEMTPLQIFSGEPAISHIKAALNRGKHAVSANKGPLAWTFRELKELAASKGVQFYFETAVMDGTPIFNLVDETLKFSRVKSVKGILNSTTNFILEEMEKGKPYDAIMDEGRKRGFIEADPAMDIEGWDAAAKITALMNVLMDAGLNPEQIDRTGIQAIQAEDIEAAGKRGNKIKLLCEGYLENGKPVGRVKPVEVSASDIYANIDGTSSVVSIETDLMGTVSIIEHEPEIQQTGYGIFSDVIRVIDHR